MRTPDVMTCLHPHTYLHSLASSQLRAWGEASVGGGGRVSEARERRGRVSEAERSLQLTVNVGGALSGAFTLRDRARALTLALSLSLSQCVT